MTKKYKEDLYCYLRISTTVQETDGDSLETQKYYGQLVSEKLGMNYVEIMEGVKTSKKTTETMLEFLTKSGRDEYEELKKHIVSGRCRNLWSFTNTRLHRVSIQDLLFFEDYVDRFGVNVFYGTEGTQLFRDTIEQKYSHEQQSLYSQQETRVRRFQSVTGKRRKSETTDLPIHLGGKPRYGYRVKNKLVEIDPKQSKIIKKMYQMRVNGKSTRDIQKWLTLNNIPRPRPTTKVWNLNSIENILRNEGYTGHYKWFDKEIEKEFYVKHPQIISNLMFQKCQKTFDQNKKKLGSNRIHESLLSDYMECECGTKYGGHTHKIRKSRIYYCQTKTKNWKTLENKDCSNRKSLDQKRSNDFVLSKIREVVSNSNILKEEFKSKVLDKKNQKSDQIKSDINRYEKRIKNLDSKISLTDENIGLVMVNELQKRITKSQSKVILKNLREELEELNNERQITISKINERNEENEWLDWIGKFGKDVDLRVEQDRVGLIEGLIKKINVYSVYSKNRDKDRVQTGHKLKIGFKLPIVNDELVYRDSSNKNLGYDIKNGSRIMRTESFESFNKGGRGVKKKG